ncbi:MAG TPA: hypothetical protein VK929_04370 [Longimicrobiales bacterium]|nr:hypothetical protein [Longimicrobiales bacterium]
MQPRKYALRMERRHRHGTGGGEHFTGYGAMALAFQSGDVVALHRLTASSAGPPFVELWHRTPDGHWTFHSSVDRRRSVARYFANTAADVRCDDIEMRWTDGSALAVTARRARIRLALRLAGSPAANAASVLAGLVPESVWSLPTAARATRALVGAIMGVGPLPFSGTTDAGHTFHVRPLRLWRVAGAVCVLAGRDPGPLAALHDVSVPAGMTLSTAPIFMAASVQFRQGAERGTPAPSRDALLASLIQYGRIIGRPGTDTGSQRP